MIRLATPYDDRLRQLLLDHLKLDPAQVRSFSVEPGAAGSVVVEWDGRANVDRETFGQMLEQARLEAGS